MNSIPPALSEVIPEAHWVEQLGGMTPEQVISELLDALKAQHSWLDGDVEMTRRSILSREREATTGIGYSVAIPHQKNCPLVETITGAFGRSQAGVEWAATDGAPAHLFFLILTPEGGDSEHVQVMRKIVTMARNEKTVDYLRTSPSLAGFGPILLEADAAPG